ncbi:hypothetical protein KW795_01855 [Candidatus Microgenomates bacterium]|nr:hypothetical protein [Candidatus Microgenomates bacterium]
MAQLNLNSNYFKDFEEVVVIDNNITNLMIAEKIFSKSGKPFYLFLLDKNNQFNSKSAPQIISLDDISQVSDYFWNTTPKRLFLYGPTVNISVS